MQRPHRPRHFLKTRAGACLIEFVQDVILWGCRLARNNQTTVAGWVVRALHSFCNR